jgi:hypothetical protein
MADVVLPYAPLTGDTLSPDGLNQDLYQAAPSVSLYETTNGSVELANFASGFTVKSHHVRPGEAGDAHSVGATESLDFFQDAWGKGGSRFYPIAGCTYTWHQRWAPTVCMIHASVFATVWRAPGSYSGGAFTDAPNIRIRMFLDDPTTGIEHTLRTMPQSVQYAPGVMPAVGVHTLEARVTRHLNLSHVKIAGKSSPFDGLTAGWHTLGLQIHILPNYDGRDTTNADHKKDLALNGGSSDDRPTAFYHTLHRARLFVRNISVVPLL